MPFLASGNYTKEEKVDTAQTVLVIWFLIKNPWIVFLTFRVNATNVRIDQDEERERKRRLEIQDAIRRRNERLYFTSLQDASEPPENHTSTIGPIKRTRSLDRIIYVKEIGSQKSPINEFILKPLQERRYSTFM